MKKFIFCLLMLCAFLGKAHEIKVKLYSTLKVNQVHITPDNGLYHILAFSEELQAIDTIYDAFSRDESRTFVVSKSGKKVLLKKGANNLGSYDAIRFVSATSYGEFAITASNKNRVYEDNIQLRIYDGNLQMVNIVDLEKYVAGVVESEGGHIEAYEYFKAQAVLARTFALKNYNKHLSRGYNLKDDVSSQVYFSKCHYKNADCIIDAVLSTNDTVLVTQDCEPILGVFHANSGGQTVSSSHAWSKDIDYLKPKIDSFSVGVGSYSWEKKVSKQTFFNYYASQLKVANNLLLQKAILNFSPQERQAYFTFNNKKLKLTSVRFKFGLRSTNFTVEDKGEYVLLKGKGYGHGVGLSQDGAMEMSNRGFSYKEILQFYFSEVELEKIEFSDCEIGREASLN